MRTARRPARRPRALADNATCRRQPAHRRTHDRTEATIEYSSSTLARNSSTERSGKADRDRFSTCISGCVSSPNNSVEVALVEGDHELGRRITRLGECRAFPCVVASLELAIGALEVVLVETALIGEPPVIVDLEHV